MKTKAWQQCIIPNCSRKYSIGEIRTTCDCGELLDIRYKGVFSSNLKKVFQERKNRSLNIFNESGVWRYREFINFLEISMNEFDIYQNKLASLDGAEGRTRPFHLTKVADFLGLETDGFWLQFEGDNPTGSFKDNGMATAFTHAKAVGAKKIICASTGNTSSSAAAFAANELDMEALVFIGKGKIAKGKLAQTLAYGAKVIQIKGDFDDAMNVVKELSQEGFYTVNSLNPFRLEGQKTIMFRMLDHLDWETPDWIILPGGNLGNTSAFGKAFIELYEYGWIKKKSRIAVVNAEGAPTLHELYNKRQLSWNKGKVEDKIIQEYFDELSQRNVKANTKATAIEILKPVNLKKALRTLEFTDGVVTIVSDEEIMDSMAIVNRNGFGCEPASAATVAGAKKLIEQEIIEKDETVVGILTGHMLKDFQAIVDYHFDSNNRFANPPISVGGKEEILELIK